MRSTFKRLLLATTALFSLSALPAYATALIGGIPALIGGIGAGGLSLGGIAVGLISMGAQWLLSKMLTPEPKQRGIKGKIEMGGDNSPTFIVGEYATPGMLAYRNTLDKGSNIPEACLVDDICLSALPIDSVSSKIYINNEGCNFNTGSNWSGFMEVDEYVKGGDKGGYCLGKFHTGDQNSADNWLLDKFGNDPDRPFDNDTYLPGCGEAIMQSWYSNRGIWSGWPEFRFVVRGLKLYDPRKDSTVGGSGSHRWGNPSTWEFTKNPKVIEYNIIRGIRYNGDRVWGGDAEAYRLPLDYWFAAMNVCDETITKKSGAVVKRYEIGAEISFDDKPIDIINEINKSCDGFTTEYGGTYKTWCGGPGLAVGTITDDDWLVTAELETNPFQPRQNTFNTCYTTYPEPRGRWEIKDGPRFVDQDGLAEDGEELGLDLALPFVTDSNQAQRLARSAIKDSRRQVTHAGQLPPFAYVFEPFDRLVYVSDMFGYTGDGKDFMVASKEDLPNVNQQILLREINPDDTGWLTAYEQDTDFPDLDVVTPGDLDLAFSAFADEVEGASGRDKPAIRAEWTWADSSSTIGPGDLDLRYIDWRIRRTGTTKIIARNKIEDVDSGSAIVTSNVLRFAESYEIQFRPVPFANRAAVWTDWLEVTMLPVAVPGDLTLTPGSDLGKDGKLDFFVRANWSDVGQHNNGYGVKVTIDGVDDYYRADHSRLKIPVKAPATVAVQVRTRASDGGTPGDYCDAVSVNVTKKDTAPTTPTQLDVTGKHRRAVIKTEDHPDDDFRRWCVYYSKTNNFTTATKTRHSRSNRFPIDDLDNGDTYYFWITAEDTSGNESAKYPSSNTAGVAATMAKIDDDDTDDSTLAAPTGLTLTKVQDTDEEGSVKTYILMECDAVSWATSKTTYKFRVTVGGRVFTEESDEGTPSAKFHVQKTGVLHSVQVRGIKGNGNKGSLSGAVTITPTKKSTGPSAASGLSASGRHRSIRLRWAKCTDSDYKETIIYRSASNSFASAVEIDRRKGTSYNDFDSLIAGTTYYYWVAHVNNSDAVGAQSSVASSSFRSIITDDVQLGATAKVNEAYTAGSYGTFGSGAWQVIQSVVSQHRDNPVQDTNFVVAKGSFQNVSGAVAVFDVNIERKSPTGNVVVASMPDYSLRDNEYAHIEGTVELPIGDTVNGTWTTFELRVLGQAAGNNVAKRRLITKASRT